VSGCALRWPAGFSPGYSDVWARGELIVPAPPAVVFEHLTAVDRWERGFSGLRKVRGPGSLEPDSEFDYEQNGLRLRARVTEWAAGSRLAWSGQGIDISVYQAWVITGGRGSSRVLAGFAARGAAAVALRETDPGAAQATLDKWLADLKNSG
jgi:polyketide cyclase/dehydrase/lipid transport protein